MIGKTILHYKILEKIGEGGMGEVYKAQDTKLDRFVALKFLPSQLTTTEEDKARFIQEAKAASAMNHPNVCTIHSIEEYDKQLFIVMEYVEGKTLKDKKDSLSEKQILEIGIQVSEGLAAAHEKGIVHRDIKPENIMVRKDGIAQIMDFGLAKLYSDSNVSRLTKAGTTMGTMGYMSPEQVQGLDVDHRTDIFSLGVVLYELLSGESPFKGMHETAIMYEIVNVEAAPISTIKKDIDPFLDGIILECLEKEKDDRYQSAKELAKNLRKIKRVSTSDRSSKIFNVNSGIIKTSSGTSQAQQTSGTFSVEILNRRIDLSGIFKSRLVAWVIAVISIIAAVYFRANINKPVTSDDVTKFLITTGDNNLDMSATRTLAISYDGRKIVYSADGKIYLRKMDQVEPEVIPGADGGESPFFSPDDKWIAIFKDKKLEKISLNGGAPNIITGVGENRGGDWGNDGKIVYTPNTTSGLYLISGNGGNPVQITTLDSTKQERTHRWPCFLPDGKHIIFTVGYTTNPTYYEDASIDVVNTENGKRKNILKGASSARYMDGYLLYSRSGNLYAVKFDAAKLEIKGQPFTVLQNVSGGFTSGVNNIYTSDNGLLAYIPGTTENIKRNIVKIDMQGNISVIDSANYILTEPTLSPDNKWIAFHAIENNGGGIWIYNIANKIFRRLTFGGNESRTPRWSPDGKSIAYSKVKNDNQTGIFIKPYDGSSAEKEIYSQKDRIYIDDWTKDGQYLLYEENTFNDLTNIMALPLKGNKKPIPIISSQFDEYDAKISPDGKWICYISNESGGYQLWVKPFILNNKETGRWQLTNDGAEEAVWAKDGKSIYFRTSSRALSSIPVSTFPTFTSGSPKVITNTYPPFYSSTWLTYDISNDSKYIIATSPVSIGRYNEITVIQNFTSDVDKMFKQD